jgi:hypothetical protein
MVVMNEHTRFTARTVTLWCNMPWQIELVQNIKIELTIYDAVSFKYLGQDRKDKRSHEEMKN